MTRGKITLTPGDDGAPWDLELHGHPDLNGAGFVLEPNDDGTYTVQASPEVTAHPGGGYGGGGGVLINHAQAPPPA